MLNNMSRDLASFIEKILVSASVKTIRLMFTQWKKSSSHIVNDNNHASLDVPLASPASTALPNVSAYTVSYRYHNKDKPSFIIKVQSTLDSSPPHLLHISRTLSQISPRKILEVKKIGRGKVLVQLSTYEAANRLVFNSLFSSYNLKAFIPSHHVLRLGIVRNVPGPLTRIVQRINFFAN